jgi:ribosomal protein L18
MYIDIFSLGEWVYTHLLPVQLIISIGNFYPNLYVTESTVNDEPDDQICNCAPIKRSYQQKSQMADTDKNLPRILHRTSLQTTYEQIIDEPMQHAIIQINVGTIVCSKFSAGQICLHRSAQHIATQSTYIIIETAMSCGLQSLIRHCFCIIETYNWNMPLVLFYFSKITAPVSDNIEKLNWEVVYINLAKNEATETPNRSRPVVQCQKGLILGCCIVQPLFELHRRKGQIYSRPKYSRLTQFRASDQGVAFEVLRGNYAISLIENFSVYNLSLLVPSFDWVAAVAASSCHVVN